MHHPYNFGNDVSKQNQQPFTTVIYTRSTKIEDLKRLHTNDSPFVGNFIEHLEECLNAYNKTKEDYPLSQWNIFPRLFSQSSSEWTTEFAYGKDLSSLHWTHL
jgi:hypothetical protein